MVFGRNEGSKMLHKIKPPFIRIKRNTLMEKRIKFSKLFKKIWNSCGSFGG